MTIPYLHLARLSARRLWRSKILWLFGIFVADGAFFIATQYTDVAAIPASLRLGEISPGMPLWSLAYPPLLWWVIAVVLISLVIALIRIVSEATLTAGVMVEEPETSPWWSRFVDGTVYFLPVLVTDILAVVPAALLLFAWGMTVQLAWSAVAVVLFSLMIVYIAIASVWRVRVYMALVHEHLTLGVALQKGFRMMVQFPAGVIKIAFVRFVVAVLSVLVSYVLVTLTLAPFALLVFLLVLVSAWYVALGVAIVAVLVSLAALVVTKGLRTAYLYTFLTLMLESLEKKRG